jgi:hypothetical protein
VFDLVHPLGTAGGFAARVGMQGGMYPSERGGMRQKYRLAGFGGNSQIAARGCFSELRIMALPTCDPPNDVTVYLVEEDFGQRGRAYLENDPAEADHETIVRNFISGQYNDALRVVAFNTVEGWSRDVSEEIAYDVLDRAYDPGTTLGAGARRFIDRHVTTGMKRPAAPSILRQSDQSARKKA